jgi:hypothetical protein
MSLWTWEDCPRKEGRLARDSHNITIGYANLEEKFSNVDKGNFGLCMPTPPTTTRYRHSVGIWGKNNIWRVQNKEEYQEKFRTDEQRRRPEE